MSDIFSGTVVCEGRDYPLQMGDVQDRLMSAECEASAAVRERDHAAQALADQDSTAGTRWSGSLDRIGSGSLTVGLH